MNVLDELYARLARCRVGGTDLVVEYLRRDRLDYLDKIVRAQGGSYQPLRSVKANRLLRHRANRSVQTVGDWRRTSSEFRYRSADGTWRTTANSGGQTRTCEYEGGSAAVRVNGTPISQDEWDRNGNAAWRDYIEPGLRHMLEPATILAAADIIDIEPRTDTDTTVCTVKPMNTDLLTTPLVSPWADHWIITVDQRTGRILHAASSLEGEVVVEHELTIIAPA